VFLLLGKLLLTVNSKLRAALKTVKGTLPKFLHTFDRGLGFGHIEQIDCVADRLTGQGRVDVLGDAALGRFCLKVRLKVFATTFPRFRVSSETHVYFENVYV